MSEEIIKSGEEVVKEFFDKVGKDPKLDEDTREAVLELFRKGDFRRTSISKRLESIRTSALGEENDETEKD